MCRNRKFVEAAKDAQIELFESCPTARKVLAHRTGQHNNTVDKHATGESVMSIASLTAYAEAGVDPELLSLLLPDGFQIVKTPAGLDHNEIAPMIHDYMQAKTDAHHPDSPNGSGISDCEEENLNTKFATIREVAA